MLEWMEIIYIYKKKTFIHVMERVATIVVDRTPRKRQAQNERNEKEKLAQHQYGHERNTQK